MQANKRGTRGAKKNKNDPEPTTDFSSDRDYIACGIASGGEAKS
jgi:hypothetical protein